MNDDFKNYIQLLIDNKDKIIHLPEKDIQNLLDYITNLQHTEDLYNQLLKDYNELEQAYQELKDSKQWWNNRFNAVQRDYEDYKSRIEKAVEYIKKFIPIDNDTILMREGQRNYLLNILNGRSDE